MTDGQEPPREQTKRPVSLSGGSEEPAQEEIWMADFHYSLGKYFSNCSSQNQFSEYCLAFSFQNEREERKRKGKKGEGGGEGEEGTGEERVNDTIELLYFGNFSISICGLCFEKN